MSNEARKYKIIRWLILLPSAFCLLPLSALADYDYADSPEFELNLLTLPVGAGYDYSDSPEFQLDLLTLPTGPTYDYADSSSFALNLYPVNRGWADSGSFSMDIGGDYQSGTVELTASCRYEIATDLLTISATAFDRATGNPVTTGTSQYDIPDLDVSGDLAFDGSKWTVILDFNLSPPPTGQYTVYVTIGNNMAVCRFSAVAPVGVISGTISDVLSDPMSGVSVKLYRSSDYFRNLSHLDSDTTIADGTYRFDNLLPGWYVVHAETEGYLPQYQLCQITLSAGAVVNLVLATEGSLASLLSPMQTLSEEVRNTMDYEADVFATISSQAVPDLSASIDAWDVASLAGDVLSFGSGAAASGLLTTIAKASRKKMAEAISTVVIRETLKAIRSELIDVLIQETTKDLLPSDVDGWEEWSKSELKGLDLWSECDAYLENAESEFATNASSHPVTGDFSFGQSLRAINSQKQQLCRVQQGAPVSLMALADPAEGGYALSLPMGYQTWLMDHAAISLTGGITKVATTIQIGSGAIAVGTSATGVGLPAGAVAGTVCAAATAVKTVSAVANTGIKFHGAFTYVANAKGWCQDIAALPLTYSHTKDLLESESGVPYYLSGNHSFSGQADLDLNNWPIENIVLPPLFLPMKFKDATVEVTNTSDVTATFRVLTRGWWDYHLPGDWPIIGGFFGGVTNIKVPTSVAPPRQLNLSPTETQSVSVPYMGFYVDPVNMFSAHWLQADVYAGPFLVDTVSKPYWVIKFIPFLAGTADRGLESTGLAASFTLDDQPRQMEVDDYQSLMPVVTNLAATTVDPNQAVFETQHTVDSNSWSISFKLIADGRAEIALQVYDSNGNCVGYDSARGGILNEFIATYTGNGSGIQEVEIPNPDGNTYIV